MASADYAHHFSSRNIPFGIASSSAHEKPQAVTRIENTVLFLDDLQRGGLLSRVSGLEDGVFAHPTLNKFASLSGSVHKGVREAVRNAFDKGGFGAFPLGSGEKLADVGMHLPVEVGDFVGRW